MITAALLEYYTSLQFYFYFSSPVGWNKKILLLLLLFSFSINHRQITHTANKVTTIQIKRPYTYAMQTLANCSTNAGMLALDIGNLAFNQ